MIFQEPMTSFNPVFTVGNQIGEASSCTKDWANEKLLKTIDMLASCEDRRSGVACRTTIRIS